MLTYRDAETGRFVAREVGELARSLGDDSITAKNIEYPWEPKKDEEEVLDDLDYMTEEELGDLDLGERDPYPKKGG